MNTFYLGRHGKTKNNEAGRLSGWVDTPLTEDGLVPTVAVIEKLKRLPKIDAIYASDLGRAFITAYEIAYGLNLLDHRIIRLPGLREVNYGDAANMKSTDAYKLYPKLDRDTHYTPPNGESLDDMQKRAIETVAGIDAQFTDATLLIVAHSGDMAALNANHTGQDFGEHNISEAYAHEYLARFTIENNHITSFEEVR